MKRQGYILLFVAVVALLLPIARAAESTVEAEAELDAEYIPMPLPIALVLQTAETLVGKGFMSADMSANKADLKKRAERYSTYEDNNARANADRIQDILPHAETALESSAFRSDRIAIHDYADRAAHRISLGAHSAKRDLKVFKRLQKHEIEDVERRAQFRLGKDLESVREFETAYGKRLHRESRESDLRLQNKLDENDTVLRGHKQTLEQRLDEARARFQDKIKNMQRKAELRVSRRQREANELQEANFKALENAESRAAARLQTNVASSELRRHAARQASEAQILVDNAAGPAVESERLSAAMRNALREVRRSEAQGQQRLRLGRHAVNAELGRLERGTNAVVTRLVRH